MAYKGMGGTVKVPKKIKTPVGTEEKLIYANDEEIEMLRQAGGSGAMTPYGGVRSYYDTSTGGQQSTANSSGGFNPSANYTDNTNTTISRTGGGGGISGSIGNLNDNDPPSGGGGDSDSKPTFSYSTTETREYDGKNPITLQELYKNKDDIASYLDGKQTTTTTETRTVPPGYTNSGQEYEVTITTKGDPRADEIDSSSFSFKKDRDGNIIGWVDKDGGVQHDNNEHWHIDEQGRYFYVGEGAVAGAGGEGSTTIIGADGNAKKVGARTYAQLLGYDENLLNQAIEDRQKRAEEMGQRQEYYGGTYNPETGKFEGGLEQKYQTESDRYMSEYDRLMGEASRKDTEAQRRFDLYGGYAQTEIDRARQLAGEQEKLAMDSDFYRGLQSDTDRIQRDLTGYRGRIAELAERAGSAPRARQNMLYAQQAEQIDADAGAQRSQLQQMLASRGISPNSPVALRMLSAIDGSTAEQKRNARRTSLFDAMAMREQESASKSALFAQAGGMTGAELGAIQQKAGIRGQRIGALGQAQQARTASGQSYLGLGQYMGGSMRQSADFDARQAGMQAATSGQMFQRSTFYGGMADQLNKARLAEAMDRQYGQENKQSAGLSLQLSKYGMDKQADMAEKIAKIQAQFASGGSGATGNRRSLLGTLAGGAIGYFATGGTNPYAMMAGANMGGSMNFGGL